jgi:hypothetical protein
MKLRKKNVNIRRSRLTNEPAADDRRPIDKGADRVGHGAQSRLCSILLLQADDGASSVPCVSELYHSIYTRVVPFFLRLELVPHFMYVLIVMQAYAQLLNVYERHE